MTMLIFSISFFLQIAALLDAKLSTDEIKLTEKHRNSLLSHLRNLFSSIFSPFWSLHQASRPQRAQQKLGDSFNVYLTILILSFTIFLVVAGSLYIWILSRQVRPRKIDKSVERTDRPPSPTSKRMRNMRSYSFSDLHEITQLKQQETSALNQWKDDSIDFPLSLQLKFGSVQLNWIYEALSRVFSFLREDFLPVVTKYAFYFADTLYLPVPNINFYDAEMSICITTEKETQFSVWEITRARSWLYLVDKWV